MAGGAYLLYLPFFTSYTNVAASGIGFVRICLMTWAIGRRSGGSSPLSSLPGWWHWTRAKVSPDSLPAHSQGTCAQRPTIAYFTEVIAASGLVSVASLLLLLFTNQTILAICLPALGIAVSHVFGGARGAADTGAVCVALLAATGLAVLAGTQVVYLKDHLQGGDAYRMNTLFKFYNQAWVLWGVAAAIALPRIFSRFESIAAENGVQKGSFLRFESGAWQLRVPRVRLALDSSSRRLGRRVLSSDSSLPAWSIRSWEPLRGCIAAIPGLAASDRDAERDGFHGERRLPLA